MTLIKICGIRRIEDIQVVNKYLPNYVGFIFAESKRKVSADQVIYLKKELDPGIKTVGVFVNESIDKVADTFISCRLDCIQLHGDETPKYIETLKNSVYSYSSIAEERFEIWKALRVKDESFIEVLKSYKVDAFVLDTFIEGCYGGAGKTFDWKLANLAKAYGKVILAGGLSPENVSQAVESVKPYGVDVSSGVEADGWKDESKIKDFINEVNWVDREVY